MAYYSEKETSNPFLPKLKEKWRDLIDFEGDSFIETCVKSFSELIVLLILLLLLPIGVLISVYNSFYNLQKRTYDSLKYNSDSDSQFTDSVRVWDLPSLVTSLFTSTATMLFFPAIVP